MHVKLDLLREPPAGEAILVCGLPGIAYVGKLTAEYLIQELHPEIVGELHSPHFPAYVLINKDGVVELMRNELHYCHTSDTVTPLFLFTGNTQAASPEGQFLVAEEVLDAALKLGVKTVYSVAAFLSDRDFEEPRVYATATDAALLDGLTARGVVLMTEGSISGTNGLLFALAKTKGLDGICLLGETRGYRTSTGHYLVDVKAVRAVLTVLTDHLGLQVDLTPLDKQAEKMEALVAKLVEVEQHVIEEMQETEVKARTRYIT
jgi:uncharacterized protein (TIGR00162 family)